MHRTTGQCCHLSKSRWSRGTLTIHTTYAADQPPNCPWVGKTVRMQHGHYLDTIGLQPKETVYLTGQSKPQYRRLGAMPNSFPWAQYEGKCKCRVPQPDGTLGPIESLRGWARRVSYSTTLTLWSSLSVMRDGTLMSCGAMLGGYSITASNWAMLTVYERRQLSYHPDSPLSGKRPNICLDDSDSDTNPDPDTTPNPDKNPDKNPDTNQGTNPDPGTNPVQSTNPDPDPDTTAPPQRKRLRGVQPTFRPLAPRPPPSTPTSVWTMYFTDPQATCPACNLSVMAADHLSTWKLAPWITGVPFGRATDGVPVCPLCASGRASAMLCEYALARPNGKECLQALLALHAYTYTRQHPDSALETHAERAGREWEPHMSAPTATMRAIRQAGVQETEQRIHDAYLEGVRVGQAMTFAAHPPPPPARLT